MTAWLPVCALATAALFAQPAFKADVIVVRVEVEVSDREGTYVDDLTSGDFVILDEGSPVAIAYFGLVKWRTRSRVPRSELRRQQDPSGDGPRTIVVPLPPTGGRYYVIGFVAPSSSGREERRQAVPGDSDGFHRIDVQVKRPGVTVRAPKGYSSAAAPAGTRRRD